MAESLLSNIASLCGTEVNKAKLPKIVCESLHQFGKTFASMVTFALASCGTVLATTSAFEGSTPPTEPLVGNYYFLPKAKLQIDGTPGEKGAAYTIAITETNKPDQQNDQQPPATSSGTNAPVSSFPPPNDNK